MKTYVLDKRHYHSQDSHHQDRREKFRAWEKSSKFIFFVSVQYFSPKIPYSVIEFYEKYFPKTTTKFFMKTT